MKPTKIDSGVIVLEKDKKGYVHVKLYHNADGIEITHMTSYPKEVNLDKISRTILFLKERYIKILLEQGIITSHFQSKEGYWCGMISIDVFFELDSATNGMYTHRLD